MATYNSTKKKSSAPMLIGLLLFAGVVTGVAWYFHSPAQVPPPVVAAVPKPKPVAPVAAPMPEPAPPAAEEPPAPQDFAGFDFNDPQVQAMMQERMKQMNDNLYGDLFSQMNLSPDQQSKVDDLMMQRAQAVGTFFQNAIQQGAIDPTQGPPGPDQIQQFQQQIDQAQAAANAQLRSALGAANYQQLQARDQQLRAQFQQGGFGGPGGGGFGGPGGVAPGN